MAPQQEISGYQVEDLYAFMQDEGTKSDPTHLETPMNWQSDHFALYPTDGSVAEEEPEGVLHTGTGLGRLSSPNPDPAAAPTDPAASAATPDNNLVLACHFFKMSPERYRCCDRYELKTINRVKKHLREHHYQNDNTACDLCNGKIGDGAHHGCRGEATWVSTSAQHQLSTRAKPGDRVQQWYEIWDLLFPGAERPRSPCLDPRRDSSESMWKFMDTCAQMIAQTTVRQPNMGDGDYLRAAFRKGYTEYIETGSFSAVFLPPAKGELEEAQVQAQSAE